MMSHLGSLVSVLITLISTNYVVSRQFHQPTTTEFDPLLDFPNDIHKIRDYDEPSRVNTYHTEYTSFMYSSRQSRLNQRSAERCFKRSNQLFAEYNQLRTSQGDLINQLSHVRVPSDEWNTLLDRIEFTTFQIDELITKINRDTNDCDNQWQHHEQYLLNETIGTTPGSSFTFILLKQVNETEYLEYSSQVDECWKQEHTLIQMQKAVSYIINNWLDRDNIRTNHANQVVQSYVSKLGQYYGLISDKRDECRKIELSNFRFKLIKKNLNLIS